MSFSNAMFRVFLLARALRVPVGGQDGGGYRALCPMEVEAMLSTLRTRSVPSLDTALLGDWFPWVYVPLFSQNEIWAFSSAHNKPTLLRTFWRAVLEMLFDVRFAADLGAVPHPLIFFTMDHQFQIDVTDEWGDGWYLILQSAQTVDPMISRRSRAGTPEVPLWAEDDA